MSLRILGAGLVLLTLTLAGCHSNQSRYGAYYAQPAVVASPCPTAAPCNSCGAPPPAGVVTPPVGY